jgi:hypothetical protein
VGVGGWGWGWGCGGGGGGAQQASSNDSSTSKVRQQELTVHRTSQSNCQSPILSNTVTPHSIIRTVGTMCIANFTLLLLKCPDSSSESSASWCVILQVAPCAGATTPLARTGACYDDEEMLQASPLKSPATAQLEEYARVQQVRAHSPSCWVSHVASLATTKPALPGSACASPVLPPCFCSDHFSVQPHVPPVQQQQQLHLVIHHVATCFW